MNGTRFDDRWSHLSKRQQRRLVLKAVKSFFLNPSTQAVVPKGVTGGGDTISDRVDSRIPSVFSEEAVPKVLENAGKDLDTREGLNFNEASTADNSYLSAIFCETDSSEDETDELEKLKPAWRNGVDKEQNYVLNPEEFKMQLSRIFIECKVTISGINRILNFLRIYHPFLPKDSRTLLKTPRKTEVKYFENGQYCHIGFEKQLVNRLKNSALFQSKILNVDINVDGASLYNSSLTACWPILGRCPDLTNKKPFVIGLYAGEGKPDDAKKFLEVRIQFFLQQVFSNLYAYFF